MKIELQASVLHSQEIKLYSAPDCQSKLEMSYSWQVRNVLSCS